MLFFVKVNGSSWTEVRAKGDQEPWALRFRDLLDFVAADEAFKPLFPRRPSAGLCNAYFMGSSKPDDKAAGELIEGEATPLSMAGGEEAAKIYVLIKVPSVATSSSAAPALSAPGVAGGATETAAKAPTTSSSSSSSAAPAPGSEELIYIRRGIEQLLAFQAHEGKSEDMSAMTSEPLKRKKNEYKEVAPVDCTKTGTVPSFDWRGEDGQEKKEKPNHPHLQEVLNKTLEPAGFYALLPTNTAKEDTTYPLSGGAARKVKGQPDAYIFKLGAGFNRNAKVDLGNMGRAVAVVEWKTPSTMEVDGSYSQMCFEVFAFGERLRGIPVIGLLTDHSTSAALFSFHASKGTYQVFESAVTGMSRSYLMPLNRAILELVEWLKADRKPIQHALPVIPEDELDGGSGEGDGSGDGGGSERRSGEGSSGEGGSGGGSSGERQTKPSDGTGASKSSSAGSQGAPMGGSGRTVRSWAPCAAGSIHVTPPKDETAREAEEDDIESACTADDADDGEVSWPTEAAEEEGCFDVWRSRVPAHLAPFLH